MMQTTYNNRDIEYEADINMKYNMVRPSIAGTLELVRGPPAVHACF